MRRPAAMTSTWITSCATSNRSGGGAEGCRAAWRRLERVMEERRTAEL
jgi:hypothetical protein